MIVEQEIDFKQLWDFWIPVVYALAGILHLFLHVPYLLIKRNFLHQIFDVEIE